jgi:D-sedoheptulose 7-phosphate isomerase
VLTPDFVRSEYLAIQRILEDSADATSFGIAEAGKMIHTSIIAGGTIFFAGNGGSAAQALHLAGEFVGKFRTVRRAMPAMALGDNIATLTAIANDFSYKLAFGRQLEAFGQPGDVLVVLSTSGNSESVVNAAQVGRQLGIGTIGLTGKGGGELASAVDILIAVPATDVAHIQEVHQIIGHFLCSMSDLVTK